MLVYVVLNKQVDTTPITLHMKQEPATCYLTLV